MANSYYNRIYEYTPRTKAIGQQVKDDFQGTEIGFDKLPAHNDRNTGFDETFVVKEPTGPSSPVPKNYMENWVKTYVKDYVGNQLTPDVPDGGISWTAPIAIGGETVFDPPFKFVIASVYINGIRQDQTRGAYTINNNKIVLSEPVYKDDQIELVLGNMRPANQQGDWLLVNNDYKAKNGEKIIIDSSNGIFTITMPDEPSPGYSVFILDVGEMLYTQPVVISGNGNTIMDNDFITVRINNISMEIIFFANYGWRIIE